MTTQQRYLLRILTDSYKYCVDITEAIAPPATVEKLAYRKVKKILQELIVSDGIKASPTACQIMTNISEQRK